MKPVKFIIIVFVSVLMLAGKKSHNLEDKDVDEYLLGKAKNFNKSNECEILKDALKIQQARIALIKRVPELDKRPTYKDLSTGIEINIANLNCADKIETEFCSWNLKITDNKTYTKMNIPINIYLIAILNKKQKEQLQKDLPPDIMSKLNAFEKAHTK